MHHRYTELNYNLSASIIHSCVYKVQIINFDIAANFVILSLVFLELRKIKKKQKSVRWEKKKFLIYDLFLQTWQKQFFSPL